MQTDLINRHIFFVLSLLACSLAVTIKSNGSISLKNASIYKIDHSQYSVKRKKRQIPVTAGFKFKTRHIRQGTCQVVHSLLDDGKEETFKANLYSTRNFWPDFEFAGQFLRTKNSFILSKSSRTTTSSCIEKIVSKKCGNIFADGTCVIENKYFSELCNIFDVKIAHMNGIYWKNDSVDFNTCFCGIADFKIGFINKYNQVLISHYERQFFLPGHKVVSHHNRYKSYLQENNVVINEHQNKELTQILDVKTKQICH